MKVDVAIITALPRELEAVLDRRLEDGRRRDWKPAPGSHPDSIRQYHLCRNSKGLTIAAVQAQGMGQLQAAIVAGDVLLDCAPEIILLVGIAAGIGRDVAAGDVLISNQIIDYELAKLTEDGKIMDYQVYQTSAKLLEYRRARSDEHWSRANDLPRRPDSQVRVPKVHEGDIFSGNKVVASEKETATLLQQFRKAIGLEMESAGVASLLSQRQSPSDFMMIKAVSDRGDPSKSDEWQEYAAHAAAAYAFYFLESDRLAAEMKSQRLVAMNQEQLEKETGRVIAFVTSDPGSLEPFQQELVKQIVHSSLKEVNDVVAGGYSTEIGHGQQFLLRAGALFGAASRIHATSLDTVSKFWTNPYNRGDARKYLRYQAPNGSASRLFVFSNADTTHEYGRVLDLHDHSYENVFVCSMRHYTSILADIASGQTAQELRDRDFAVLAYPAGGGSEYSVFAELDDRSLAYKRIDLDRPGVIDYRGFLAFFDRIMKIERGRLDEQGRVLRWQEGLWGRQDEWARILQTMFDKRESDFVHMVFFKFAGDDKKKHREMLARIKRNMQASKAPGSSIKEKYRIQKIWLGRTDRMEVRDFIHRGHLRTTENVDFPYVLIMWFEDQEGLRQYYEDRGHADLREELYKSFDERRFRVMYGAVNAAASEDDKRPLGDFIEAMAERFISRRDYSNLEMIQEMVSTTAPYIP